MVAYADSQNLVQVTPGEISPDQALPNFYYTDKDKEKFLLRWAYLDFPDLTGFWDSVGSSLEEGSYITCLGSAGTLGELGLNVATVRVVLKEKAEPEYKYPYRIKCEIGPNSLYSNQSFGPGSAFRSNISGANLVYKGIIEAPLVAGPSTTITLGNEGIEADCWCWATITKNPTAPDYAAPLVISWVTPGANEITLHFASGNQPGGAGTAFVYLEAYKPLVEF